MRFVGCRFKSVVTLYGNIERSNNNLYFFQLFQKICNRFLQQLTEAIQKKNENIFNDAGTKLQNFTYSASPFILTLT